MRTFTLFLVPARQVLVLATTSALILVSTWIFAPIAYAQSVSGLITAQLDVGARGENVIRLQTFLAQSPSLYPEGLVTGYFGVLTEAAVKRFQTANEIEAVGRVGPITLARINALITSGGSLDISVPVMSNVQVSTTANSATITWITNELALGKVHYGVNGIAMLETSAPRTQPVISGSVAQEATMGIVHSITLTGLTSNTVYHYEVDSTDIAGNVTVKWPTTFITK